MERTCLDCGETLRGRADQKFCSDACRNNYNNRMNRSETNFMRNIQNILRRNRRILSDMNNEGLKKVHQDALIAKGFHFDFHTNVFTTKDGQIQYYCYEQGYKKDDDEYYSLLMRKFDEVDPFLS
jgi:predicted nucleic acid-binding Zn ribbon protein